MSFKCLTCSVGFLKIDLFFPHRVLQTCCLELVKVPQTSNLPWTLHAVFSRPCMLCSLEVSIYSSAGWFVCMCPGMHAPGDQIAAQQQCCLKSEVSVLVYQKKITKHALLLWLLTKNSS